MVMKHGLGARTLSPSLCLIGADISKQPFEQTVRQSVNTDLSLTQQRPRHIKNDLKEIIDLVVFLQQKCYMNT